MKQILLMIAVVGVGFVFDLQAKDKPTNFVIFLTDDQGWGDLGVQGHPRIKTPNLDKFASQGVRLDPMLRGLWGLLALAFLRPNRPDSLPQRGVALDSFRPSGAPAYQ